MPQTHRILPGDHLPDLNDGDLVTLLPGAHRPLRIPGIPNLTIQGAGVGQSVIAGSGADGCTIRAEDGGHGLALRGFTLSGPATHGAWITVCDGLVIEDVEASGYEREAILTGHCGKGQYRRLHLYGGTGDDHSHALYVSGKAAGSIVEDCNLHDCPGSALQMNSASLGRDPATDLITGAVVRRCRLANCGSGGDGTPLLSLMGVVDSSFEDLEMDGDRLVTMFADGRGGRWACYRNAFQRISVRRVPAWGIHEEEGSGKNRFVAWVGFSPPGMIAAPPAPAPPPTVAPPPAAAPPVITPPPPAPAPAACDLAPLTAEIARLRAEIEAWPPNPYLAAIALAKAEAAATALTASLAEVRAALKVPAPAA